MQCPLEDIPLPDGGPATDIFYECQRTGEVHCCSEALRLCYPAECVLACSADAGVTVDASTDGGPWTMTDYVAAYDANGNGTVDPAEAPGCYAPDCDVICDDTDLSGGPYGTVFCIDHSAPAAMARDLTPVCPGVDGNAPYCQSGVKCPDSGEGSVPHCVLPWNDPRVIVGR